VKDPQDIPGYDAAAYVVSDAPMVRAHERFGGFAPDDGRSYWCRPVDMIDRIHATYCVLDAHQLDKLDALRDRLDDPTARESAFLAGLWTECMGVASAENAQ
jgi:hypothetical protein